MLHCDVVVVVARRQRIANKINALTQTSSRVSVARDKIALRALRRHERVAGPVWILS
jgi:hypothetical protein